MWTKSDDWFWEGKIQSAIAEFLHQQGYEVQEINTLSKAPGPDIFARSSKECVVVEVKGWPSDRYVDGAKQGQPKKTQPATQARHWFSEALSTAILRKTKHPRCVLAIGLPEIETYLGLIERSEWALQKLDIRIYLVSQSGQVKATI